jgi:Xaa-Pro aminopeptidase
MKSEPFVMFQSFADTNTTSVAPERVASLRSRMRQGGLDAFLVPRGDEHRGEYVPPSSERLAWLTGFTGSAGFAIVGLERAALLVDGRYTVQAKTQLPGKIFEILQVPGPTMESWLVDNLPSGATVGFDPWLHSLEEVERATERLKTKGIKLKAIARNPVDVVWGAGRPARPSGPIMVHPTSLAGVGAEEKVTKLQEDLAKAGHDAVVLTAPDSIAWLLNIRGNDIPHTPVALCFAILPVRGKVQLFIDPKRLDKEAKDHLKTVARAMSPDTFGEQLKALAAARKSVLVAPATCNWWIVRQLGGARKVARGADPCVLPKAIKTKAEIRGSRRAHIRDGAAMCRFLAWLDRTAPAGGVDEIGAARQLEAFRAQTGKLQEISFDTISGSGPNGAIVHYRVTEATNRALGRGELYLVDSGGQYRDATTDITRTVVIGTPTDEMRDRFTRVLKGHIAIAAAIFPEGSRGVDLDPLARHALWAGGFDFDHGTGHGVGSYLSVHEGPQSISKRGMAELKPGMIISNEPGYYKEGSYGIRIENLLLVCQPEKPEGGDRPMLSFETLTLAPIDRRLVDTRLLSAAELAWLNDYHARVLGEIGPGLEGDDRDWLNQACAALS